MTSAHPSAWMYVVVLLSLAVLLIRDSGTDGRTAFLNDSQNLMPNPSIEVWDSARQLPLGWSVTNYSGATSPAWKSLSWSTSPVHNGTHSVFFDNKGATSSDTRDTVGTCYDWCLWDSLPVYVGGDTDTVARLYVYATSLTQYDASPDGPRLFIWFYSRLNMTTGPTTCPVSGSAPYLIIGDAGYCHNGTAYISGRGTDSKLLAADFNGTPAWQDLVFLGRTPGTSPYATLHIEIGTRIQTPNLFKTSFYLDDAWIETANGTPGCAPDGAVQACNPPTGGTQTCTNSQWSPCVACQSSWTCSGFGPCVDGVQTQTCTDANACVVPTNQPLLTRTCTVYNITDYIDQYLANTLTMPELMTHIGDYRSRGAAVYPPEPALVSLYDTQLLTHPLRFSMAGGYGWQGANALDSLLTMYDATKDVDYLAQAKTGIDLQMAGGLGAYGTDSAQHANLISQYLRFAYYVRRDGRTQYDADATQYYTFAVTNFLTTWSTQFQSFTKDGQNLGCIIVYGSNWVCDRWNAASGAALALLYAHLYQPNAEYLDKASRQARFFKTHGLHLFPACEGSGSQYLWGYRANNTGQPGDTMFPGNSSGECAGGTVGWGRYECDHWHEETHYALYELRMVYAFWEQHLIFTDADMAIFANTFQDMGNQNLTEPHRQDKIECWRENSLVDRHNAFETGYLASFAKWSNFDTALNTTFGTIVTKVSTSRDSNGHSQYYQCVTKADDTDVCWSGATLPSGSCTSLPGTYPCRVVEREMIFQGIADLTWARTRRPMLS